MRLVPASPLSGPGRLAHPSRRARLARALDRLGALDRLLWLRAKLKSPILTVLTYHRITERARVTELDRDVVETDARGLAEQIALVKTGGTIVSLADVRLFLKGKPLPPNPVLIAFDDGYAECHDVALPVLQRASAPAAFFVPTAYPDAGRLFWWDRIALLLHRCPAARITLHYPIPLVLEPARDPDLAKRQLLQVVKRTPSIDLSRLWEELERATGVVLDAAEERRIASRTILSWSKVRALHDAGMAVQSHSHSHRVLTTLTPDEVRRDLLQSRQILRDQLGEEVRTVAYPVGYRLSDPFQRAVEEAGFDLGFTNASGLCNTARIERLNVPRLAMESDATGALYKLLLLVGQKPHPLTRK